MASGGVASGKISLSVELIENYKEIASKLQNGLKGNIKEIPLDATFDDKKIAKQVEEELSHINEVLDTSKMKKLDWSNVIPPLSQILFDNSLEDTVRLQIIQGFRAGIDSMPHYLKSLFTQNGLPFEKQKTGEQIAQQLIDSATLDEAISSMGLNKWNTSRMRSGYRNVLENPFDEANKDLAQIISMMSIKQDYADVLHLLVGGDSAPENAFQDLKTRFDKGEFRKPDLANAAGFVERLKYIADQKQGSGKEAATKVYEEAEKQLGQIFEQAMKPVGELGGGFTQEQLNNIIGDIRTQVRLASEARDNAYREVNPSQYGQEGVSILVAKIREMLQSGMSRNVEASITGKELGQTLDINSLFNIISGEEKDTSEVITEEQQQNEERKKAFDEFLQRMLQEADEKLSEEEKQRIERRKEQRKTEALFHNLFRTRGKTGIDSGTENYYNAVDLESINDKFENDVELLKKHKTTIDNQIKEAQEAKTLLEKENEQIAEAVMGNFTTKGSRAAKKQLLEKQKAYDEADESNKETAWVEYYKAYQNMMKPDNTPKKMTKELQERLAADFGETGEFSAENYTQHVLNLKEQWVKNTTSLEDLLKTIGEFQAKKRLIDEKIAEPTTDTSSNTTNADQSKKTSSGDATQPIVRTIEEIKEEKANLEREIASLDDESNELRDQLEEIRELLRMYSSEEQVFNPNDLFEHENSDIQDWANQIDEQGYELTLDTLKKHGQDISNRIDELENDITTRNERLTELNNLIGQHEPVVSNEEPIAETTGKTNEQADADQHLGESANNAADGIDHLNNSQRDGVQTGQQAGQTAKDAATAMQEEADAANADADAQDRLATSRQNANNAKPPSTPTTPVSAPTPENPPTHPETPVRTGNIKGMEKEKDDADELTFKFISAAEAKQAFVDANKEVKASADASAESMEKESKAALKAKFGFDPEELQNTIDTTQKIQTLLTQMSTAISQMDNNSNTTGIVEQLTKVAEAMGLIVESAQQVGNAMSAVQTEGGLKVDLQNELDIQPLIAQFEELNKMILQLMTSFANIQSAIGAIDDNSGIPSLLTQINSLVNSLDTISKKEFGFTFNVGKGNVVAEQGAKNRQTLNQLKEQYNILDNYFQEYYSKTAKTANEAYQGKLVKEFGVDSSGIDYLFRWLENYNTATDSNKSMPARIEAYQGMLNALSEYAQKTGADLDQMFAKFQGTPDELTKSAQEYVLNTSPSKQLEQIFGKDNSVVLDTISNKIQEIITLLGNLNTTLSSLSDGSKLTGLKEVFEQIPQKIEEATQKIFELKQQIDTAQFSAGFDEQFKGLTEQLEAAKEQTKATNEEFKKTTQLLNEEKKARADLQKQVDQYKKQDSNAKDAEIKRLNQANENRNKETASRALMLEKQEQIRQRNLELQQKRLEEDRRKQKEQEAKKQAEAEAKARVAAMEAKRQAEIKAEQAQIGKEDTALGGQGGEYARYKADYRELYNAKTIEQYNTALTHLLDTEQRIQEVRQQAILSHGTATDIMQLGANGVEGALSGNFLDGFTKSAEQQKDTIRAIQTMQTAYIDEQQASIAKMTQSFQQPKNLAPEVVSGWGEQQRTEYQKMTDGANLAKATIESLNRILADMRSGKFNFADQNSMEVFMELKNALPDIINNTQQVEQSIGTAATNGADQAITELDKIESSLLKIKDDSQGFIVVDDNLKVVLNEVEKHLQKIKDLKDIINNNPLSVLQTGFSTNLQNYLTQMNGSEQQAGIVQEAQSVYKESETSFKKIPQYFTQYGNALKRFFDYLSQGGRSLKEITGQMDEVQRYAQKLTSTTGLDATKLLNGNLGENATQAMTDNQESARAKYEMGFQSYLTTLNNQIKNAESTLQRTLGTQKFGEAFEKFTGSGRSFEDFKSQIEGLISALQKLKDFEKGAKAGGIEFFNEENLKNSENILKELMPLLDKESFKEFSKNASGFKIIDDDTLSKARAEMQKFINDNPALSGDRISAIKGYIDQLQSGINNIDYTNAVKGFERIKTAAIEANNTGSTFFTQLQTRFKSLAAYLLSFVSFYRVIGVFKDGLNIIKELDTALTEMNKVSTESLNSLKEYQKESFDMANGVGTTAVQLQQSTADFIRLGESFQEAKESARVANELMTVSEFDNIQDATTALVSISAAYEDAANGLDKQAIIDKLNKIGDEYAISTDGLATALQDSASALTTANNDMDEAAALIAAGNTVTQDPSKTGKAMRTVALRLVGTKEAAEELEEMGEDTSDMIMSQSKMREMIMNATKVASNNYQGVDIQDEIGRYKSTFQILNEIGSIWDEIKQADLKTGDNRQNLLLEAMAGKNRANTLASVLMNNDILQSAYQDSKFNAAGKATEELEKVSQGIEFHLTRLRNAWQELWANAANRDVINFFIDLATKIVNIIDKVGLLGTAFTVVWGASVVKSFATADSWLVKIIRGLNDASNSGKTFGQIMQDAFGFGKKGDTRWKGLAQINEDNQKRKEREQPTAESVPATTPIPVNEQKEKETAERIAREKVAAEEIEREKKIAREKAEAQRIAAEQAEADRIRREKAEAERRMKEKAETEKRVAGQAVNAENEAMVKASASITEKGQAEATSAKEASLNANASKEATESVLAEAEANKILTQEVRERINAQVAERRQELNGTKTKFSKAKLARMQAEDDTYRKELEAEYINEYKKNNPQPIVEQPVPVVQPTSVASDSAEVATKTAKAEASREVAQATAEELTWAQLLRQEEQEGIAIETEGLATKTEEVATSQQVAQGNLEVAESAEIATKATQEQLVTEEALAEQRAANQLMNMSPKSAAQFSDRYDKLLKESYSKAGKETMDWSMSYVTVGEEVENIGEEVGDVVEKTSSGLGVIGTKLLGLATNPMVWLIGIPALIGAVNLGLSAWQKHQQALIDGAHEATTAWNDNKTSIDNYIQQYQDLHTQLDNVNLSEEEQANIKKQLFDLQKQITDEYGHQADGVNLVNGQLDEQIQKLRTINKEQATNNLGHNATEYNKAIDEMERQRTLEISSSASLSDEDFKSLVEGIEGIWGRYTDQSGAEIGLTFTGNATEAEKAMDELFARLSEKQDEMKQDWEGSTYELLTNGLEKAIRKNDETLSKFKDNYNSYLEQSIYAQDGTFGKDNLSAGDALIEAQKAVNDYNMALLSGDSSQIEKTKDALDEVKQAADEVVDAMGDQRFNRPFQDIFDQVNKTQEEAYNVKKKFDDPKVKNIVESVLGTPQENKKSAKEIPDALRDAAENLLDEQRKAYEWGMKPFGVNPLQMMYSQSQFGNIDMNNRPTIKWNDNWKKQFAEALKSWNYNPENRTIDTVFGGSDNFNGLEIAYTPILATKDGKVKDFMSYDAVHDYIQGLVEEATDEEGNIDAQMVLNLDADKKQIIGAIDGIGKYSAQTVGKMMHFSGKKGAISLGMEQLSKAAKNAGVDVQKVLDILQKTGNVDALSGLFDDFKYNVTDIEGYLSNLSNLPPEIADDILTIADAFGITANSSSDSINAVAELLGSLGYIATTSLDEAGESFDQFAQKASGWIEETSNLSSVLSKGQGFLTFTKTQDDQGHEIASEVKALADAYKDLPGYNYASLFEETAGGIMVNAEALRALQSQEESMRHAEFYEKRQKLMKQFMASSGAAAEAYRTQIEELDMLWSAYSGATSALSKYQNNHGAADYSTNYKLFRDQIFKEGDEYLNSGEIGEEGFRRVAQLFSYKDLALASVDEVLEAYQNGADTMQKFFTEDPTEGANLWIDEIMSWPEEYAKISTNAAGETVMTMTDQNLDAVAKHYGVSKDLILSLMNELNATGSRVHFFTDGQMQQLEQVNERAEAARKALIEMKDQGTDPALANSDILNFDMANMSAEELEAKIKEIQDLRANPDIDTETASLLDELLKNAIESLDIINGKEVKPQIEMDVDGLNYTKEVTEDLNERLKQISEYKELGYDISISGDDKVREVSQEIASWSEEMQKAYGFEPSVNPEDIAKQIEEKFPNGVELKVAPKLEQEEVDAISSAAPEVKVNADTLPAQTAIQELGDDFTPIEKPVDADTTEAEEKTDSLLDKITAPIKAIFGMEVYADEVDEAREEAEQPIETDVHFNPDNSIQDAANQAGAQQGVQTKSTETKVTNEEIHTTVTSDTSQADTATQTVTGLQALSGTTVDIGLSVSGIEQIQTAETNIDSLIEKGKAKIVVSINGNASLFNKTYSQTNTALNNLAQKKTEPKITANNSNLKDKVSEAKNKLNSIDDKKVHITASNSGFGEITTWKRNTYDNLHDKDIKVTTHYSYTGDPKMGKGGFQGSAHNQGTIVSKGHAYAKGGWGLPENEYGALINEVAPELVVDAKTGQWQILNNGYPTFANLSKGSIIFNGDQTEEILKNGYIRGSYGRIMGGAFFTGTTGWNEQLFGTSHAAGGTIRRPTTYTRSGSNNSSSNNRSGSGSNHSGSNHSGSNNNSSSNKKAKDNLQTLDAIEIRLNRIDALISKLDTNAAKTYDTFTNRNTALKNDLATVNKEIQAINASLKSTDKTRNYLIKAADAAKEAGLKSGDEGYSSKSEGASGKALSQNWINKIKNFVDNGKYFTVTDVRNEGLWKKIQAYQTWYEKYVKLQQKVQDQTNKLSQLTIQQLTLIQTKWETSLNNIAADITKWQNTIDLANEKGYDAAEKYYNAEILLNKNRTKKLEAEAKELENKLKEAVKTGRIKEGSEEWYKWHIQIKNVKNEIIATNKEIQSLLNSIRQIRWDTFDRGQDELADMIDEAEFLGGLINEIDLFDKDTGFVTDKGKAAFGLEAQKYDLYIKQAQKYGEAVKELNAEIAKDPNNKTLIDQRNTWLKAQREAIENAHAEKEAIADLVEKGIKKQIEAMEELIDKYEKALDAEKDQQKYADSIAEKQKKINSLQKQLRSMEGDDSEEGATRRQKLRDELKEAQKDLEETQEDQRISDIKDALSDMQERYEEFLNTKLENIDALLQEVVSGVNQSGADICSTIQDVAHSVNYTISSNLQATYTAVQNLGANVASIANQIGALVSGTSDTTGTITNTSATTVKNTPTPVVPTKVTMPTEPKKTTGSTGTSKAKNGIVKENGKTYYYKNGKKQTGWQTINGKKYYFSTKDSNMLTGVQKIGNKYYLLDKSTGVLKDKYSGLYKQNSGTYYFKNGDMQTGWQSMNAGKRYFSTKNGKMLTGVQTIGKDNYYFNEDGVLQVGKFNVGDYTYETDKDGKIKKKTRRTGGVTSIKGNTFLSTMSYIEGKGTGGITGFASGTKKVLKNDIYRVDEMGKEAFINKQGKIYTRLEKGTTVLPHDAAVNLLKGMSNPAEFIASHMDMRPNKTITTTNNNTGNTVNNITFNLPNVSDYKEFMREAQRDPNFTKYIQEISIGKLNGNNSLRGNAIQFR